MFSWSRCCSTSLCFSQLNCVRGKGRERKGIPLFFNWQNLVAEHISFVLILLARLGHVGPCSCKGTWKLKS